MSRENEIWINIAIAIAIAVLGWRAMSPQHGPAPDGLPPANGDWSFIDHASRQRLASAFESLATQIADDQRFSHPKIQDEQQAIAAVRSTLNRKLGSQANSLESQHPGLSQKMQTKIGSLAAWPQGRDQLSTRLRNIAQELSK